MSIICDAPTIKMFKLAFIIAATHRFQIFKITVDKTKRTRNIPCFYCLFTHSKICCLFGKDRFSI